jgi:hypothetical protein
VIASSSAALGPPPPKLMLIVLAPRSAATRIASTMVSSGMPNSLKPSLTTLRRQPKPAPAIPRPLSVAAQARPEVWLP